MNERFIWVWQDSDLERTMGTRVQGDVGLGYSTFHNRPTAWPGLTWAGVIPANNSEGRTHTGWVPWTRSIFSGVTVGRTGRRRCLENVIGFQVNLWRESWIILTESWFSSVRPAFKAPSSNLLVAESTAARWSEHSRLRSGVSGNGPTSSLNF